VSGDVSLAALLDEVLDYPRVGAAVAAHAGAAPIGVVLPVQLRLDNDVVLSFFTSMTVFGAPLDVTLSELAVESFFPADEVTATAVQSLAG
jgi:hypothetical protein